MGPHYWSNLALEPGFREHGSSFILANAANFFRSSCRSAGCRRDKPLKDWSIRQALRIENTWLWESYCQKKKEIAERIARYRIDVTPADDCLRLLHPSSELSLDASLNEVYLLHGCDPSS